MKWCVVCALCVAPLGAQAQLFAVAAGAPSVRLVRVDPDTGDVSEIGVLAIEGIISNMEFVGQRLYAVDRTLPHGGSLIEVSTNDASVLSRHRLTLDGEDLRYAAEGLGYDWAAGSLVQAFWQTGANHPSTSNAMGYVAMDGSITSATGYGSDADFDGLATRDHSGSMYWVDRSPGTNEVHIGTVSHAGAKSTLITYDTDSVFDGVNDVSLAPDRGELLATDSVTGMVHRLAPDTAQLLGSVMNGAGEGLNTCAYRVACPADLAPAYGVLDLSDVSAFITAFVGHDHPADLAQPYGVFDLWDIAEFVGSFVDGCP